MSDTGIPRVNPIAEPNVQIDWAGLLIETYSLYLRRFWALSKLAIVPAALACAFRIFEQFYVAPWVRGFLPLSLAESNIPKYLCMSAAFWFLRGVPYAILSGFFCAGVSAAILRSEEEDELIADGFGLVRERLGSIAACSVLVWTLFCAGQTIVFFLIAYVINLMQFGTNAYKAELVLFLVLLAGLISRLGRAIPAIISERRISVPLAIRTSILGTAGTELFFSAFLLKSWLIGYAAFWLAGTVLAALWNKGGMQQTSYSWVSAVVFVMIGAMLETPLFIAFSLLHKGGEHKHPATAIVS